MAIKVTDELVAKTKKGKVASASQVYLEGDEENLQQIGEKTKQLESALGDIAATGGASTANAVAYSNETSGLTSVTAQGAFDELASKSKEAKTNIEDLTAETGKKFNKDNIETGDSLSGEEDKVPSSALVKKTLATINKNIKKAFEELPKFVQMTQADYEALENVDDNTYYMCTEG